MEEEDEEGANAMVAMEINPLPANIQLTRSSSFLTRIKSTFGKSMLLEEPDTFRNLMTPSVSSPVSSRSSFEQTDMEEQDALEHKLVKQMTELFSKSMFLFSNTWGMNRGLIVTIHIFIIYY